MTEKDILRMAHDAELTDPELGEWMVDYGYSKDQIKKFAELVAAAEREACAQVCESWGGRDYEKCATAIRERNSHVS